MKDRPSLWRQTIYNAPRSNDELRVGDITSLYFLFKRTELNIYEILFWLLIWKQNRVNWEPMSQSEQLESQGGSHVYPLENWDMLSVYFNLKSFISERKRDVIMGVGTPFSRTDFCSWCSPRSLCHYQMPTTWPCILVYFLSFFYLTNIACIQFNSIQLFSACIVYLVHLLLTEYWKERAKKKGNGELQMRLLSVCPIWLD